MSAVSAASVLVLGMVGVPWLLESRDAFFDCSNDTRVTRLKRGLNGWRTAFNSRCFRAHHNGGVNAKSRGPHPAKRGTVTLPPPGANCQLAPPRKRLEFCQIGRIALRTETTDDTPLRGWPRHARRGCRPRQPVDRDPPRFRHGGEPSVGFLQACAYVLVQSDHRSSTSDGADAFSGWHSAFCRFAGEG